MLIDLLIILVVIFSIARNWHGGFVRQFWPTVGFFGGLLLGRLLEPTVLKLAHSPSSRAVVIVVTLFGLAIIGLSLGEYLGINLKYRWLKTRFNSVDNALGSILTTASVLFGAWIIASVIASLPPSSLQSAFKQSAIIRGLDQLLPPAPKLLSDVGNLIDPNGFPDVFIGSEPIPKNVKLPSLGELSSAVSMDENSVDRIQGLGCGGLVSGSGFVVGTDLVATNAHVVAGISHPVVEDSNGHHNASVIWFDPNLDFAVLRVNGDLAGGPLSINTANEANGTPSAVLGYPGGGSFNAAPAALMDEFIARGQNIYGSGITLRDVYEIQADVIPGNSGGPLVAKNGQVIGVVFAASTTYSDVGYALTMSKVASEVNQASSSTTPVSTGQCAN